MPAAPRPPHRAAPLLATLVSALVAVGLLVVAAPATADGEDRAPSRAEPVPGGVRLVQANIYTGLTVERFQQDVATVLAQQPDLVTYNEVPFRSDAVMAPPGYSIWRDMRNRFTAATPVAWRSDRYTAIDQGVFRISNWRGKPPGREIELGRRFANWVTLRDTDGRTLSVVSIHIAPTTKGMPDLLRRSVTRLGVLTERLSPFGPVLVGGDFNVHYTSGRYPRDLLTSPGLVPTFDTLGGYFPTGDHFGATIDYVFNRGAEQLVASQHFPVELRSDHDAVVADLTWVTDLPTDTTVVRSDPAGGPAERRAVLARMSAGIRAAAPGATVRLVTSRADLFSLRSRLRAAAVRGVAVQVSVTSPTFSDPERRLVRQLRASGQASSWARRCRDACAQQWAGSGAPRSLMLVSDVSGAWTTRYDTGRALTRAVVQRPTKLVVSSGPTALRQADVLVRRVG
jgi:endonuclease/exonuclease/phosphatase (EEP) superfamily protein YafD